MDEIISAITVVIRVDASITIGAGHVMRCLALASVLRERKALVHFICRDFEGNMCQIIEQQGFNVYRLPKVSDLSYAEDDKYQSADILSQLQTPVDWLVVDSYNFDAKWETHIRPLVAKILVIDDLANRDHDCDLLVDQNLYENLETRYSLLVPQHCQLLLGNQYIMIRKAFLETRKLLQKRDGYVKRILLFFGGSDPTNETVKALQAIKLLDRDDIKVDVVIGGNNPHKDEVQNLCRENSVNFYCQVDNMDEIMAEADLAIGADGTATWERFCLGLPSIIVTVADNQVETAEYLGKRNLLVNLGSSESIGVIEYKAAVIEMIGNSQRLITMSEQIFELVDGLGIYRVIDRMLALHTISRVR